MHDRSHAALWQWHFINRQSCLESGQGYQVNLDWRLGIPGHFACVVGFVVNSNLDRPRLPRHELGHSGAFQPSMCLLCTEFHNGSRGRVPAAQGLRPVSAHLTCCNENIVLDLGDSSAQVAERI